MKRLALAAVLVAALAQPAAAVDNCPFPDGNGSYHKATYTVRHTNAAGEVAWQIWLTGESCVNRRGIITAHRWNKRFYVNPDPTNWWEWDGWTGTQSGGGDGQRYVFRRVNAHLKLCILGADGGFNCVKDAYPYVQVTMQNEWPWSAGSVSKGM